MDYLELAFPQCVSSRNPTSDSVLHINTRSLNHKKDDVAFLLDQFQLTFSAIMLTETWGRNDDQAFSLDGYNAFSLNRSNKRGGGVALLVTMKKNCHVVLQFTVVTDDYEILTIRCKHELISVLYRPPNGSIASFLLFYETFLEVVCNNNLHLVSAGDFNINMMEESNATRDLNTLLQSTGFTNLITTLNCIGT